MRKGFAALKSVHDVTSGKAVKLIYSSNRVTLPKIRYPRRFSLLGVETEMLSQNTVEFDCVH